MEVIIKNKIEELLSKEFYCSSDELNGKSTVYSVNFNAKQPYIKILVQHCLNTVSYTHLVVIDCPRYLSKRAKRRTPNE